MTPKHTFYLQLLILSQRIWVRIRLRRSEYSYRLVQWLDLCADMGSIIMKRWTLPLIQLLYHRHIGTQLLKSILQKVSIHFKDHPESNWGYNSMLLRKISYDSYYVFYVKFCRALFIIHIHCYSLLSPEPPSVEIIRRCSTKWKACAVHNLVVSFCIRRFLKKLPKPVQYPFYILVTSLTIFLYGLQCV